MEIDYEQQYEEVRAEYYYPPTSLSMDAKKNTPFYIQNGDVHVCPESLKSADYNKSVFRHEIGHFCICPVSIETHQKMYKRAKNGLEATNKEYNPNAHIVCNVVADIIVDQSNFLKKSDPLVYRMEESLKDADVKKSVETDPIKQVLVGVINKIVGKDIVKVNKKYKKYVDKLEHATIKVATPYESRCESAARILKTLIEEEAKKQEDKACGDLEKIGKALGWSQDKMDKAKENINRGTYSQRDFDRDFSTEIRKKMWKSAKEFAKNTGTTGQTLIEGGADTTTVAKNSESLEEFEEITMNCGCGHTRGDGKSKQVIGYYKAKAIGNICFKVKVRSQTGGKIVNGGLVGWGSGEDVEDLDIEESVSNGGILIPDVTTLQYDSNIGCTHETLNVPKVQILYDVSGSMPLATALITIYSLIESCKANYIPVSVVTFSTDVEYSSGFNHEYSLTEQQIYNTYSGGGTNMQKGVVQCQTILAKEKDPVLLIIVSDYDTQNYTQTIEGIQEIAKKHKVCPIKFGDDDKYGQELKPIKIQKLEDLYTIVIEEFNRYIESATTVKEVE